ncbi:Hypothetical predicted protein [Paramuricea clavata]|uniref:Uncharacterized protein n=1 Tax=Paramuricea clavata TaxID=317549 RepID=A0A6S7GDG6_PARCT|nr:Hypothetical predicted protein [Paramuricea clavata]
MPIMQHDQLQIEHERATEETPGVTQGIPNSQPPAYILQPCKNASQNAAQNPALADQVPKEGMVNQGVPQGNTMVSLQEYTQSSAPSQNSAQANPSQKADVTSHSTAGFN